MNRTAFLVDGFNLYHSLRAASIPLGGRGTKWLDLNALCRSYLHIIGGGAELAGIHYFSALAKHLEATKPDVTRRHQAFISCLEATGVTVRLSRFKRKSTRCKVCGARLERYEEKETDVAIASTLLELFHLAACDTAVILSGDSDLVPATRAVQRMFGGARVLFAFPYGRKSKELAQLAPGSFQMTKENYARHQLPDPFVAPNGNVTHKPPAW